MNRGPPLNVAPTETEFSQRFEGTFADGGDTIRDLEQLSYDEASIRTGAAKTAGARPQQACRRRRARRSLPAAAEGEHVGSRSSVRQRLFPPWIVEAKAG